MAKKEAPQVASLNPADMLSGLKDDFRGVIKEAVYCAFDYDGNVDKPVLAGRLTIEIEGEDDPFVQHWSAGDLAAFVPSEDGKTPAGEGGDSVEDFGEGEFALKVGKRAQLNNNTNWAHLIGSIIDSGEASEHFKATDLKPGLSSLVGLDCQWNRVQQKKRAGLMDEEGGEKKKSRDVLVVTEVFGYGESDGKKKKAAKAASAKGKAKAEPEEEEEAEEPEVDEFDAELAAAVLEIVSEADGSLKKSKLGMAVMKKFAKDPKAKAKAVKRCTEDDFLSDVLPTVGVSFDEDSGTLSTE